MKGLVSTIAIRPQAPASANLPTELPRDTSDPPPGESPAFHKTPARLELEEGAGRDSSTVAPGLGMDEGPGRLYQEMQYQMDRHKKGGRGSKTPGKAKAEPPHEGPGGTPGVAFRSGDSADTVVDAIFTVEAGGRIVAWSGTAANVFGYAEEEIAGQPIATLIPERFRAAHHRRAQLFLATGEAPALGRVIEIQGLRKSGAEFPMEVSVSALETQDGPLYRILIKDKTHNDLSRQGLVHLFEISLDMLLISRADGYLVKVNPALQRALGYSEEELLSRPLAHFINPEDISSAEAELMKLNSGTPLLYYENRLIRADGSPKWVGWTASPLPGGLICAMGRDITEKKLEDQQFRDSAEERIRLQSNLLQSVREAIAAVEVSGRVTYWGAGAVELFGYSENEAMGSLLGGLICGPASEGIFDQVMEHALRHGAWRGHLQAPTKGGEPRTLDLLVSPVTGDGDTSTGVVVMARDVTEQVATEAELMSSRLALRNLADHLQTVREEERTSLAREIHDEMGQPITALKIDASYLKRGLEGMDTFEDSGPGLVDRVRSMMETIAQMHANSSRLVSFLRPPVLDDLGL